MVLERVVVVVRVCRLRVAPWHWWERWRGLVMGVGVSVVHVVVWCGRVRRVGWVACGPRLCSGAAVMKRVEVALVSGHRGAGAGVCGSVLMLLVVPRSLAVHERRPMCGLDFCGQRCLCGVCRAVLVQGRGAAVRGVGKRVPGGVLRGLGNGVMLCSLAKLAVGAHMPGVRY